MARNIAALIGGEDLMNYSIPLARTIRLALSAAIPRFLRPPNAILLDVGDTILRQHWFDLSLGIDAIVHDRARSAELATAFREYELPAYARRDECLLAEWLRSQEPSLAELSTEAVEDRIWAAVVRMEPLPRVDQVLASLAADRVPIGAVSNAAFSGRAIHAELERHGLATQLQFVLSSADLRMRNPAPGIYSAALERLRARASETWFVGDTFDEDIVGATAVGLQPVWLTSGRTVDRPSVGVPVVRDWSEFLTLYSSCRAN
jgi:putative hydrolase of the HAD superfamily